MDDHKLTAVLT